MQFALNKKLELIALQHFVQSQSKGNPGCLVVHITIQLYISSAFKRKSDFVRTSRGHIHTLTLIHRQSLEIPNHEEEGVLKQKISMLG